jgi:hypothetical protein
MYFFFVVLLVATQVRDRKFYDRDDRYYLRTFTENKTDLSNMSAITHSYESGHLGEERF